MLNPLEIEAEPTVIIAQNEKELPEKALTLESPAFATEDKNNPQASTEQMQPNSPIVVSLEVPEKFNDPPNVLFLFGESDDNDIFTDKVNKPIITRTAKPVASLFGDEEDGFSISTLKETPLTKLEIQSKNKMEQDGQTNEIVLFDPQAILAETNRERGLTPDKSELGDILSQP
jgi:hypothetical protein